MMVMIDYDNENRDSKSFEDIDYYKTMDRERPY
jgi:hypothetical protein